MANTNRTAQAVEGYGVKGMKSLPWRRTFRSIDALYAWAEKAGAEVYGVRETFEAMNARVRSEMQNAE